MTDSDKVGTASVDILGNLAPLREQIEQAEAMLQALVAKEYKVSVGAQFKGTAGTGGKTTSGSVKGGQASDQPVSANIEANSKSVIDSIQSALTNHNFKIFIDEAHLRAQIESALGSSFKVNVQGNVSGAPISASPETGGTPARAGAVPADVTKALNQVKGLKDAVNAFYATINEVRTSAGKPRVSSVSDEPGNEPRKLVALMDEFGDNLKDWVTTSKVTTKSGGERSQITGGRLFEHGQVLGLGDDGARALADLGKRVRTLSAGSAFATVVREHRDEIVGSAGSAGARVLGTTVAAAVGNVIREENRAAAAAAPVAAAVKPEPTPVAAPEKKLQPGTVLETSKIDQMLDALKGRAAAFPTPKVGRGRTGARGTPGQQSAFDYDENLNRFLSGSEILDRTRGQLPTPTSPSGFNYAPYLRMASQGFFSNVAQEIGKNNKPTGNLLRYDPEESNSEIQNQIKKGRIGRIGESRARAIKPADLFEMLLKDVVPKSDTEETPAGSFLGRVGKKLVPGYARSFDFAPQATKFGKENASGVVSQGTKLEDLVKLDQAYIEAFETLEMLERRVPGRAGASTRELEKRQQETRDRMSHLVQQGADPSSVIALNLSEKGKVAALRHRREVSIALGRQSQRAVAGGVGLTDFERDENRLRGITEAEDMDRSRPIIGRITGLGEGIREGRIRIPEHDAEGKPLTTLRFFNQEVEKILNGLRENIGDTSTGGTDVPRGFSPVSEAIRAAKALLFEPGPGGHAVGGGRFTREISFSERDRTQAEAAAHRSTPGVDRLTTLGTERAVLEGQLEKAKRTAVDAAAARNKVDSEKIRAGVSPLEDPGPLKTAAAEAKEAIRALETGDLGQRIKKIDQVARIADRLILRESGQRPIAQNIREATAEEVRLGLAEPGQRVPGAFVRDRPSRTGAETAERIRGLKNIPEAVRQEALELISSGQGPGLTVADVRRRAGLSQTEGLTGDKNREVTSRTAFVPHDASESGRMLTEIERSLSAAGGGGSGGGRRGFLDEVTGPIHVIVDNTPLQVAWAGGGPGGGGGGRKGRGRVTGEGSEPPAAPPATPGTGNGKPINPYDIRYIKDPTIGPIPTSMRIQMRPKGVVSPEQRAAEAEADRLATIRKLPKGVISPEQRAAEALAADPLGLNSPAARPIRVVRTPREIEEARAAAEKEREIRASRRMARISDPIGFASERDLADDALAPLRARNRQIQRFVPRRGFGASLVDLVTASAPGSGALEQQLEASDRANRELAEINQAADKRSGFITSQKGVLAQARAQRDPATGRLSERGIALFGQARELGVQINAQTAVIKESTKRFEENANVVGKNSNILKSFGAAATGSVISTGIGALTFGLGNAIATPIIQGVAEGIGAVFGPLLERASGFASTTQRVTGELGAASAADAGRTDIAFARKAASIGLAEPTAKLIAPELVGRASIEAGNTQLQQQIDSLNAFLKVRDENRGRGGYDKNLTETTGGFFGLGGAPSTAQMIFDQLNGLPGADRREQIGAKIAQNKALITAPNSPGGEYLQRVIDDMSKDLTEADVKLQFFNDALKAGGEETIKFSDNLRLTDDERTAQAAALDKDHAPGLANLVRGGQLQVTESGKAITDPSRLLDAIKAIATPKATLEELIKAQGDSIRAREGLRVQRRDLSLGTLQPSQLGLDDARQPLAPAAAGINLAGLPRNEQKALNADLAQTQKLYNGINAEAEAGRKIAVDFVTKNLGPEAGGQFASSLAKVVQYGREISNIQIGIQTKQAAYQAEQFSYQIGIAKRNLADAKGLVSGIGNNLGAVERQQYNLSRESQSLALGMSQRQINFQQALAGITAPGLTGEERAARIEQAKIEAEYAQKQLDIQKKLYGLQGKSFEIVASRSVHDLIGQLALLEKGRKVTLETAVAEKRIIALTKRQELENKKVSQFYQDAVDRTTDIMQLEADLVSATGEDLQKVAQAVLDAYTTVINGLITNATGGRDNRSGTDEYNYYAGGIEGRTTGRTTITVGESAGEEVAVLKNPRTLLTPIGSTGGAGETVYIQINLSNNKFSNEADLKKLTKDVQEAVERGLGRRSNALGLSIPR